ncbi:MAG: hypothetical protein IPI16_04180 [Comamonadaceae bacterium]|nr:hypothetical protein [Comamonadaceae bacterium]
MATIKSLEQARILAEARKLFKASFFPSQPIWRRRIRYAWQTSLKRGFVVELLPSFELQVKDGKTGEVLCIGPAIPPHEKNNHHA